MQAASGNVADKTAFSEIVSKLENSRGSGIFENCRWIMESKPGALRFFLNDVMMS